MAEERYGVVLVYNMHALFRLERELQARGLTVKPIPTPRELSSDCGSALRFGVEDLAAVRAAVDEIGLETQGIHELEE